MISLFPLFPRRMIFAFYISNEKIISAVTQRARARAHIKPSKAYVWRYVQKSVLDGILSCW
jgi:hypothetical protein